VLKSTGLRADEPRTATVTKSSLCRARPLLDTSLSAGILRAPKFGTLQIAARHEFRAADKNEL